MKDKLIKNILKLKKDNNIICGNIIISRDLDGWWLSDDNGMLKNFNIIFCLTKYIRENY